MFDFERTRDVFLLSGARLMHLPLGSMHYFRVWQIRNVSALYLILFVWARPLDPILNSNCQHPLC